MNSDCLTNQIKLKPHPKLQEANRKLESLPKSPETQDIKIPDITEGEMLI